MTDDAEDSYENESVYYDLQIVDSKDKHLLGGADAAREFDDLEFARSEFADAVRDVKDAQEDLNFDGTKAPYTVILTRRYHDDDRAFDEEIIARDVVRPRAAALKKRRKNEMQAAVEQVG